MTETLHWYARPQAVCGRAMPRCTRAAVRCIFPLTCLPGR